MIFTDLFKKKSLLITVLLLLAPGLFAQSLKIPMIQGEKSVNSLAWSLDSNLFAYTDGTDIVIRDANEFFVKHTIKTEYQNILEINFVNPLFNYMPEKDVHFIILITDTNTIEIRRLFYTLDEFYEKHCTDELVFKLQGSTETKATCYAYTSDLKTFAFGYEDGTLGLFKYDTLELNYIEAKYKVAETPLIALGINSKQNLIFTGLENILNNDSTNENQENDDSDDLEAFDEMAALKNMNGRIYVWDNEMQPVAQIPYDIQKSGRILINNDNIYPVIHAESDTSIAKFDYYSQRDLRSNFKTEVPVKDYDISLNKETLLILDQNDTLNIYNLNDSKLIGLLPSFSENPVTLFTIDSTLSKFLIAHEDNTIFVLENSKVLFPKNAKLPEPEIISMDAEDALQQLYDDSLDEEVAEEDIEEEETEDGKKLYEALAMIRYKNSDTISFRLKGSVTPGPYILGASFAAGYTAYRFIQPFYFGGFLEPHIGFPQKDFPYKYSLGGSQISSPLIVGGKLYFPFGICVYPFQKNIELFVDIAPGLAFNMLWNTKFDNAITSKLYTSFYASLKTGATYKNFTAYIEGNYDAILGFGFSIGIGYNLNIIFNKTIQEEDPSLEE